MLSLCLQIALAALVGAASGVLAAYWFLLNRIPKSARESPADPFVSAEIDTAAAKWATEQGRPEAAGVMADKLHLLYALSRRRRRP